MKIIVDAYNILKQIGAGSYIDEQQRHAFIVRLGYYARQKGHTLVVVFDGGESVRPTREQVGKVTVVYAGKNTQADAFIKEYVEKHKEYDLLLVSSDRELSQWVARYKVPSLDSLAFYTLVRQLQEVDLQVSTEHKVVKLGKATSSELDRLMEEATDHVMLKEEDEQKADRSSPAVRPSKKERAFLKKIKKL